jgi:hypothetical protein
VASICTSDVKAVVVFLICYFIDVSTVCDFSCCNNSS